MECWWDEAPERPKALRTGLSFPKLFCSQRRYTRRLVRRSLSPLVDLVFALAGVVGAGLMACHRCWFRCLVDVPKLDQPRCLKETAPK